MVSNCSIRVLRMSPLLSLFWILIFSFQMPNGLYASDNFPKPLSKGASANVVTNSAQGLSTLAFPNLVADGCVSRTVENEIEGRESKPLEPSICDFESNFQDGFGGVRWHDPVPKGLILVYKDENPQDVWKFDSVYAPRKFPRALFGFRIKEITYSFDAGGGFEVGTIVFATDCQIAAIRKARMTEQISEMVGSNGVLTIYDLLFWRFKRFNGEIDFLLGMKRDDLRVDVDKCGFVLQIKKLVPKLM